MKFIRNLLNKERAEFKAEKSFIGSNYNNQMKKLEQLKKLELESAKLKSDIDFQKKQKDVIMQKQELKSLKFENNPIIRTGKSISKSFKKTKNVLDKARKNYNSNKNVNSIYTFSGNNPFIQTPTKEKIKPKKIIIKEY